MTYIVDTHCHLDLIEEKGILLDEIVKNCAENNVRILQTICTRITEIDKILSYTKKHDFIYASVGIHPCNVAEQPRVKAKEIVALCEANPKIIGIGETGLDYYHDKSSIALQKTSFLEHIQAARETNLPLIIHSRDCDCDMISILKSEQKSQKFPALLHCFSSTEELARAALDLGIYISISGIVTFKNAQALQEIVKFIPLEFLLVETDSPYLAPMPFRGQINQPAFTKFVVEKIAELKGVSAEEVTKITTQNFLKIFSRTFDFAG
ncbi:MAG: TatD family hydrolase [Proteobacteria bacterium]|nr:TatD family hydrolase [Pseudomonadota bacterium]